MEMMTMTTALVVGFVSLFVLWLLGRPSVRLPPGPRPLPLFGNTLLLKKYPSFVDLAHELKRQYGPIVTFWMFRTRTVIISSPDIIQEAIITQGSLFSERGLTKSSMLNYRNRTISGSNGERHRFLRKLLVSEVLANKRVAEFRPIRDREVDILIETLKKQLKYGDGDNNNEGKAIVTNFRSLVRLTVCNLMMGALIGRRLTLDEYGELHDLMVKRFANSSSKLRDHIPLLALLPDKKRIKLHQQTSQKMKKIFEPLIEERRQELKKGLQPNQKTFVDTLLQLQSSETQQNPNTDILDTDIVGLCINILNAGVEPTALNLDYCLANLINRPEAQEMLAQEIADVVGSRGRVMDEDDIPQLPYLQAVVKEALRRHTPSPLSTSRFNFSATKLAGYDIPEHTIVQVNLEAVGLSSQIWEAPLEFRPERHLNMTVNLTGSTDVTMIPFGVGRRICPAINIAFLHAELILARLIQAFHWSSAIPGQLVDLTPAIGMTSPVRVPLVACLRERLGGS